ncbi:BPSL0761 family protein [Pseudomonas sp. LFM046]|uniref:BPSL0761 family protein n=1 Tax=Pseudomonas sp. LFM046 TaxID=1608357 RepID=UPI0005CFCA02|nr:BPSL0761 family protein [Pseudomonas sp. LFM046]
MNHSNKRTESVIQTWDFLIGLTRDTDLPEAVREEVSSLLRNYPYPTLANPLLLGARETHRRGEGYWNSPIEP